MSNRYLRQGECRRWCGGGTGCCTIHGYQGTPEYEQIRAEFEKPPFFGLNDKGECKKLVYKHGMPTCSVYEDRPEICKTFPVHPRDIAALPECGFSFIKKPDPVVHPQPPNPYVLMGFKEEWPMFSAKKHVFPDSNEVFVEIYNLPEMKTIGHMRHLLLEVKRLEWKCWHGGIAGWLMGSLPDNLKMQGATVAVGATYYAVYDGFLWFSKRISKAPRQPVLSMPEFKSGIQTYIRTMGAAYAHH